MPLSLVIRKDIRDSEPQLKEHLEKIQQITGKTWKLEVDWEDCVAKINEGYKERIGSVYQNEVMASIAYCIEKNLKDPLTKAEFLRATPNNKIVIRVNDKIDTYWALKFEKGDFVAEHQSYVTNISDIENVDFAKIIPPQPGQLPLKTRQNIEANKQLEHEILESISRSTGTGKWTLHVDWQDVINKIESENDKQRIASLYIGEVLQAFDELLKKKLENATIKKAFNEATSAHTITIQVNEKLETYWDLSIKNGGVILQHQKYITNTGDVAYYDLAKFVPVTGVIDLVAQLNLENNRETFNEAMREISQAAGVDIKFDESSVESFYKQLDGSDRNRIGEILYCEIIPNLAYNLKNALADDMVKEAFLDAVTNKEISVRANPKQSNYWDILIDKGVFVVSGKTPICNTGEISYLTVDRIL